MVATYVWPVLSDLEKRCRSSDIQQLYRCHTQIDVNWCMALQAVQAIVKAIFLICFSASLSED